MQNFRPFFPFSVLLAALLFQAGDAYSIPAAQDPSTEGIIFIAADGIAPFDATDGGGTDSSANNAIVRNFDLVTYAVEVTLNDADDTNVLATITLNDKGAWSALAPECRTIANGFTAIVPDSTLLDSTGDGLIDTMICNLGDHAEGTKLLIQPVAQAIGNNTEILQASVVSSSDNNVNTTGFPGTQSDGPIDVEISAGFGLFVSKTVSSLPEEDEIDYSPTYQPTGTVVPGSPEGKVIDWHISLNYTTGSEFVDDNGAGTQDFVITDTWSGTHSLGAAGVEGDNANGNFSDQVVMLGTISGVPADNCSLINAGGGTVACTQAVPGGPITITLTGVPVNQQPLAKVSLKMFVPYPDVFVDPASETYNIDNRSELTSWSGAGAFITSATGTVAPGPFVDTNDYSVSDSRPGPFQPYKTFDSIGTSKSGQRAGSRGELIETSLVLIDHRTFDSLSGVCDTIDTSVLEFAGFAPVGQTDGLFHGRVLNSQYNNNGGVRSTIHDQFNPTITVTEVPATFSDFNGAHLDGLANGIAIEYSSVDYTVTGDDPFRATCEDDLDGDGVDDWVTDFTTFPGGAADVVRVRMMWERDASVVLNSVPQANNSVAIFSFDLQIKSDAPIGDYLPNTSAFFDENWFWSQGNWRNAVDGGTSTPGPQSATASFLNTSEDPTSPLFSFNTTVSDRVLVLSASMAITKVSNETSALQAGDTGSFTIDPSTTGSNASAVTMTFTDTIPPQLSYVSDTCAADYAAAGLTCTASVTGQTVTWTVAGYQVGDPLPPFDLLTVVNDGVASGTYTNTVSISSDFADFTNDIHCENATDDTGAITPAAVTRCETAFAAPHSASASVVVVSSSGYRIEKAITETITAPQQDFTTTLSYINLGGTDVGAGQIIDILPHNGDGLESTLRFNPNVLGNPNTETFTSAVNANFVSIAPSAAGETFEYSVDPYANIDHRPCHPSNWPLGDAFGTGNVQLDEICVRGLIDPATDVPTLTQEGTATTTWGAIPADPTTVTAVRITTPLFPAGAAPRELELVLNSSASLEEDLFCNNFGSNSDIVTLDIISNDVCIPVVTGEIGDFVWWDQNQDGVQDLNEPPLEGVTLKLLDSAGNPIFIDPITGAVVPAGTLGAIEYTTMTDADGNYLFENLPPGDYSIMVDTTTLPPGMTQTFDADGAGDDMSTHTLVFETDPVTGEPIDVETNLDQDFGYFIEPSSLGSTVFLDEDQDGVFGGNDTPVEGVTVTLLCFGPDGLLGGGDDIITSTVTDANGNYLFDNLLPYDYQVTFTPPVGFSFTGNDSGEDDGVDSDADPFTGQSPVISLSPGEARLDVFAGIVEDPTSASLGDTVFFDENGDGIQDPEEAGVPGVIVTATYFGPDGVPGGGDDQVFTTTTDANGNYFFVGLPPGNFKVTFAPPSGFEFTINDAGGDDTLDSDADPLTGMSQIVTLNAGDINLTVDAGLIEVDNTPGLASVLWNGFCDQQNFVSLSNICQEPVTVTVALFGSTGGLLSSQILSIGGGEQIDHSINDMEGFSMFDFGRADLLSMPAGCIQGEMGLFAPIANGQFFSSPILEDSLGGTEFLFAQADGSVTNSCFTTFNTFQPSINPDDEGLATIHYLQLVNLDREFKQNFTVRRYNLFGEVIASENLSLEPGGRQDLPAGHEDEELNRYGLVEVIPDNLGVDYTAQLFRYGVDMTTLSGERMSAFALADNCSVGQAGVQYLNVSRGAGAENWLELYNLGSEAQTIKVNVFSNTAGAVASYEQTLEPKQSIHFDAGEGLLDGESGVAEVIGTDVTLAKSTSYLYRADGRILASDTAEGRMALGVEGEGNYNSFRNQLNWLRLFNVTNSAVTVTVRGFTQLEGEELGRSTVELLPLSGKDISLNDLLNLGETAVGRVQLTISQAGAVIAEIARVQHNDDFTQILDIETFQVR